MVSNLTRIKSKLEDIIFINFVSNILFETKNSKRERNKGILLKTAKWPICEIIINIFAFIEFTFSTKS
jgi:hypothetical protein